MTQVNDMLKADEAKETLIERITRKLENELAERIKIAQFHEKVKTLLEIAERLLENGKLSPEEIADICELPLEKVRELAAEKSNH